MVDFITPERARDMVRAEPVVFAEIMSEAAAEPSLEVHVARIAAAHGWRYATLYPAEDGWPPSRACAKESRPTA